MISLERTKTRLDQLIVKGQELLKTKRPDRHAEGWVDHPAFQLVAWM